jgi:hypothetical protein
MGNRQWATGNRQGAIGNSQIRKLFILADKSISVTLLKVERGFGFLARITLMKIPNTKAVELTRLNLRNSRIFASPVIGGARSQKSDEHQFQNFHIPSVQRTPSEKRGNKIPRPRPTGHPGGRTTRQLKGF